MPIGFFSEGKTRYVLECRDKTGKCLYRKFTDEDRWNYLFNLIPPTTAGHRFRSFTIETDKQKRLRLVSHPQVRHYISRELTKLQGQDVNPERTLNQRTLAQYRAKGAVHQTMGNKDKAPPKMLKEHDVEKDPEELQPVRDTRDMVDDERLKELQRASFPIEEEAPKEFDMEKWLEGDMEIPEDLIAEDPQAPDLTPQQMLAHGSSGFADQRAVEGEKEVRSEIRDPKKKKG